MTGPRIELKNLGPARPWVGQLVPIDVTVWRPEGEKPLEPFSLDDVIAPSAIVKWSAQDPPPDERLEGDTRFLVQHRTLLVFPQGDGEIRLPPITARYTEPAHKTPTAVRSAPFTFQAAIPAGATDPLPLVATSVKLEQSFDRDLSSLKVGDGFTRTLTLTATDTDAIVFPELVPAKVPGMTAYPGGAHAESTTERGQIAAKQTYSVTYVVDRVGPHEMPGVSVRWLEPRSGKYGVAAITDQTIWTRPNWSLGTSCFGTAKGTALATGAALLFTLVALTLVAVRRVRRGPGAWERAISTRLRERRAFGKVVRAARMGSASALLQSLYAWLVIRKPYKIDRTLLAFRRASADARALCVSVEQALFRDARANIDIPRSTTICQHARREMSRSRDRRGTPRLNPDRQGGTS